ncbi:hypothetical protein GJ688_17745 [Heliobacillus mobilis]|uniref:Sigma-70 family RNA polymerase sigma factor n=1 Tax=Heliobacterium mobile TaxID=28064 RepID=A0A6I3SP33_HELMO|nr:hypothetical protein [Heliobacterium mobile]MTV50778.1 hypothetical protein [Heliobacterium mobile]
MGETELNQMDKFALAYAQSEKESYFSTLYEKVKPTIQKEAKERSLRYQIPASDFESVFSQELWRAARDFNGESHIMQRLSSFAKPKAASVVRYHYAKKRTPNRLVSLDKPVDAEGNTLKNALVSPSQFENDLIDELEIKKILEGFTKTHEHYGQIIKMLYHDCTFEEIASTVFGTSEYDARCRKGVQRAKECFKAYLQRVS